MRKCRRMTLAATHPGENGPKAMYCVQRHSGVPTRASADAHAPNPAGGATFGRAPGHEGSHAGRTLVGHPAACGDPTDSYEPSSSGGFIGCKNLIRFGNVLRSEDPICHGDAIWPGGTLATTYVLACRMSSGDHMGGLRRPIERLGGVEEGIGATTAAGRKGTFKA